MRAHPYHPDEAQPPSRIDCVAGPASLSTSQTESISRSRRPPWLLALHSSFLADGLSFVLCVSTGWFCWLACCCCMSGSRFCRLRRAGKLLGYLRNCSQVLSMRRECVVLWEMGRAIVVRRMCQREGSIRACAGSGMSAVMSSVYKVLCSGEVGFFFPLSRQSSDQLLLYSPSFLLALLANWFRLLHHTLFIGS